MDDFPEELFDHPEVDEELNHSLAEDDQLLSLETVSQASSNELFEDAEEEWRVPHADPIVFQYLNDTVEDENTPPVEQPEPDASEPRTKRGRKGKTEEVIDFDTMDQLEELKRERFLMSNGKAKQTKFGWRQPLVCKYKTAKCPVAATVIFVADGLNRVEVRNTHNHELESAERVNGISKDARDVVMERLRTGETMSAMVIRTVLRTRGIPETEIPSVSQIRNFTAYEKKKLYGGLFTLANFIQMCKDRALQDDDPEDKVGIVAHKVTESEDNLQFYAMFSTKKLLAQLRSQRHLQIDGTHKILYFCHPVQVIGFTDEYHSFHVSALAIVSDESGPMYSELLRVAKGDHHFVEAVADGGTGISYGMNEVIPGTVRRMCYFHMKKRILMALTRFKLTEEQQKVVKRDVVMMSRCTSKATFLTVCSFILDYWAQEHDIPEDFCDYFHDTWVVKLPGGGPRTNNSQESANCLLKIAYTFRRRLSVPEAFENFKNFLLEFQSRTIADYVPSDVEFAAARKLYDEKRITAAVGDKIFIPTAKANLDQAGLAAVISNYMSLNPTYQSVVLFQKKCYLVCPSNLYTNRYWCSCPQFLLKHVCKHSTMIEVKKGLQSWPENVHYYTRPLGGIRPAGRGRMARNALQRD